ncbi:MAG: hypothetical protein IT165_05965 [Bryobacterales bacterium]|nr:hypothetical protein [Bryobacterales bacterium]
MLLRDLISIAPRYARSINIERDAHSPSALEGYIVTATAHRTLLRITAALGDDLSHRAWTITGPYGSGKSAFTLFLSNLLGFPGADSVRKARAILKQQQPTTHKELFERKHRGRVEKVGFCSVLVSGSAGPLLSAIADACVRDISPYFQLGRPPGPLRELQVLYDRAVGGGTIDAQELVRLICRLTVTLQESGRAQGVLLVIDELGKFLEFAAGDPERGDIFVLQLLAEASAGNAGANLLLVTVLHQAFEQYAANLQPNLRAEWAKIQGRFEDVAYQAPPEEFTDLLAAAIVQSDDSAIRRLRSSAKAQAEEAWTLELAPRGLTKQEFLTRMQACAPLHPTTVLALARLCRKFGQNQRSLFSFLVAREPFGFVEFLDQEVGSGELPCYRLADLYDYITSSLGSGLNVGDASARWAEVQNAIDRAAQCSEAEVAIIKNIGLLSAIGGIGELKPSLPVLRFATATTSAQATALKNALVKRSLVVERRYNDTLALWEGSDIDLEGRLREASRRAAENFSIAQRLNDTWRPRPVVAKRHSYQKGTLRYFEVRFADLATFSKQLAPASEADGILIYCVPSSKAEAKELAQLATGSEVRERIDVLIAVPDECRALRDAVRQLEHLRWVQHNTPELQSDAVARRELRSMLTVADQTASAEVRRLFAPGHSRSGTTLWFHHGMPLQMLDARRLSAFVSSLCDRIFEKSPVLRNELINRRLLSSAAAAARRNLLDGMIQRGAETRLGLKGFPPEFSIYSSILEETGIHRPGENGYEFGPPAPESPLNETWQAIDAFLATCEVERRPVEELFRKLQDPPFGIKMGVLPLLLCAAVLHFDTEVAFYEDGGFVPEVSIELFERLLKNPERFQLRRYRIEGVRKEVFRQMAEVLGAAAQDSRGDLVALMRPLFKFLHRLPGYTKQTRALSVEAMGVRECLFGAKEPDLLLFRDLPQLFDLPPFEPGAPATPNVAVFMKAWRAALIELQRAYDELVADIRSLVLRAFNVPSDNGRALVQRRAAAVAGSCVEPRLRAFAHHLSESETPDTQWAEAIGTMLVGKVPKNWIDTDRARFEISLSEVTRSFRHIEAIVFERSKRVASGDDPARLLRVSITDEFSSEREAVVTVERRDRDLLASGIVEVRQALSALGLDEKPDLALAILGSVAQNYIPDEKVEKPKNGLAERSVTHG